MSSRYAQFDGPVIKEAQQPRRSRPAPQIRASAGAVQGQPAADDFKVIFRSPDFGLPRISLVRWEYSPERIFGQLFGRDFSTNEYTGITVVPGINA